MMQTKLVNPICDPDWDRLVNTHPNAGFFHGSAWAGVLRETYAHEPVYLRCTHRGEFAALIPIMEIHSPVTGRRGVCLPFSDFCAPLIFDWSVHDLVMEQLHKLACARRWRYFELRGGPPPESAATPEVTYREHLLDLRCGEETLLAQATGSVRRAVRKAEKNGLSVVASREGMREFYQLHVRTRRRHGLPPQPVSFFAAIHRDIIRPGGGFIVLARIGAQPVAGAVFFTFDKKAVFKFGASDVLYQEYRGNDLVMWEAISSLARHGYETLHLGRTSPANEGLRRFKLAWGAVEGKLDYYRFDVGARRWVARRDNTTGFYNAIFGSLPLAVNRVAGEMIYPHLD